MKKKLMIILAGAVLSASYFGVESPAFAHGFHWIKDRPPFPGPSLHPRHPNYRFVTPTGSDITVDFTRNPFIGDELDKGNPAKLNVDSLMLDVQGLIDEISGVETIATFQPSQGLYQEVVTLAESNFTFDFFEFLIPPEATTTFHTHNAGWELFYVVGGHPANDDLDDNDKVIFKLKADTDGSFNLDPNVPDDSPLKPFSVLDDAEIEIQREVPKGSFVALPAGKIHTWSNVGDKPALILALLTPSGIADGFTTVGAPAGLFSTVPPLHPLTIPPVTDNPLGNCSPTGNDMEVNCEIPENPEFYNFFLQVQTFPDVLSQLNFTDFPTTLKGARCPVVFDATEQSPVMIDPSNNPRANCPTPDDAKPVETDPFDSTFDNPFSLLRLQQTRGPLAGEAPLAAKLFGIGYREQFAGRSSKHEVFRVLEGEAVFHLSRGVKIAKAGTSVYIPPHKPFKLIGTRSAAKLIQFSIEEPKPPQRNRNKDKRNT